jgi:hypothetical protein
VALYRQLLGPDFDRLPRALRDFHGAPRGALACGTAMVRHYNPLLALLTGFPAAGDNIPVRLEVIAEGETEIWRRRFGDSVLESFQCRRGDLLGETFGAVDLLLQVRPAQTGLRIVLRQAHLKMLPLPLRVEATERSHPDDNARWEFDVMFAGVGSYRGTMVNQA